MLRNITEDGLRARPVLPLADLLWSGTAQMTPRTLCVSSAVRGTQSSGAGDLARAGAPSRRTLVLTLAEYLVRAKTRSGVVLVSSVSAPASLLREHTMTMLNSAILPALRVAKAGATGIGLPGVEPAINGVLELATMLSTMKSNKEDLSKLQESLDTLVAIDASGASGDLKQRLTKLSSELKVIALQCKSLGDKGRSKRFFKSIEYKQSIQDIKNLVTSHIRDFTLYGNISIETIVQDVASNGTSIIVLNPEALIVHGIGGKFDSSKTRGILTSLKCVASRYNAANTPEKCMDGTRVEIINDIVARLINTPDSTQVVMLSGVAGSGKSTIAKSVATILAEEKGILAASFFFSRDYAERKELKHLSTTLAIHLADYDPIFRMHLIQLLETDRTGILEAEPSLQFQKLVVDILGKLPLSSNPWVICLDALDECGHDRGQIFLRWLSDSIGQIPAHIRFFLTGRPDVPSYLKFDTLRSLMHGIILSDVDTTQVQQDIRLYRVKMWKR
ncbi:hypothetical protein FB451DRAFT_1394878 [Mycena latifolia]|nr:hypothetical protein FB451DRAFT_1394878 [Mycena latifolia]